MTTRGARSRWAFSATRAEKALAARKAFVDHLRESADEASDLDAAQLIYSELVGNVVRHAPGPISIDIEWTHDRHARLCVRDSGDGFQADYALPKDRLSEGGRGLFIVAELADTVTVTRDEAGTCVCAILPVHLAA